ncbi:hypothetical protein [Ulvibacter litoralis]|uniref:Uncharacterized protein n=1 Tax=Ulvibacter litoralis TaxID=227084 RepID=A0A1G7CQT3_9FLAO|nr:hypothetical protein [Ulvibacter litoralis]GHC46728.1 hypothetical protein GCM10008083_07240 [Ulvibacter litoralis]SDE40845.1 hypothetical protein SAMN05421855_101473 [Ulvibacter litoralis]
MKKNDLAEQLKYSSSEWLYVVTWNNLLKQLFCPFKASVSHPVGTLTKGQIVKVEAIKVTLELKTVFIIKDKAYYYYHFEIMID